MPVPVSTPSFSDMQTEYGGSNPISMSEYYRGGANVPASTAAGTYGTIASSGAISFGTMRGKGKFIFNATIGSNTSDYNIRAAAVSAGWDQNETLVATITINSGIYVVASSTAAYAMDTGSGFPGGATISIINNGQIVGRGGAGGNGTAINGATFTNPVAGSAGGPALRAQVAITVTNSGTIAGGGGGGGGGGGSRGFTGDYKTQYAGVGGGGGGGGRVNAAFGNGGSCVNNTQNSSGTNGTAGSLTLNGSGGSRGVVPGISGGGNGGAGGAWGASGGTGGNPDTSNANYTAGGLRNGAGGGATGAYAVGFSNITWAATGTRLGSTSG